ncbi:Fic family protein [Patescibacteria group bacterium]|nr:Fic family protein [Patescibacteria group bacterium]
MVNDTNINERQKDILKQIIKSGSVSRGQIATEFSKITAVRDLKGLVELKLIRPVGGGRSTQYILVEKNPHLYYLDKIDYFTNDLDLRGAQTSFNQKIFKNIGPLFSAEEIKQLQKQAAGFSQRGKNLDKTIYKRELERFIIEFAWKSSQIEGNTYDLLETETLIKQRQEAVGHSHEEAIMILNHKDAFDSIIKNKQDFKTLNFSDILQLHNLLTKGLEISAGIRFQPVAITGTLYRPLQGKIELKTVVRQTIKLINQTEFPPAKALLAASFIAYIQPFNDGNKRTARNLANAILLAYDYFPLSYRAVDVNDYRRAMIIFYEQNNLYHLKQMFVEQLDFSRNNYFRT